MQMQWDIRVLPEVRQVQIPAAPAVNRSVTWEELVPLHQALAATVPVAEEVQIRLTVEAQGIVVVGVAEAEEPQLPAAMVLNPSVVPEAVAVILTQVEEEPAMAHRAPAEILKVWQAVMVERTAREMAA